MFSVYSKIYYINIEVHIIKEVCYLYKKFFNLCSLNGAKLQQNVDYLTNKMR